MSDADDITTDHDNAPAAEPAPADDLGDAGKRAIEAERKARRAAERQLKALQAETQAQADKLASLEAATQTDQERALEAARKEAADAARAEVEAQYRRQLLEARILSRAAGKFVDPADAVRFADPAMWDGDTSDDEIDAAIAEVIEAKPYLAHGAATGHPANGAATQGVQTGAVGQLTREQLDHMTPEQIVAAKAAGQLNDLLGIR